MLRQFDNKKWLCNEPDLALHETDELTVSVWMIIC